MSDKISTLPELRKNKTYQSLTKIIAKDDDQPYDDQPLVNTLTGRK